MLLILGCASNFVYVCFISLMDRVHILLQCVLVVMSAVSAVVLEEYTLDNTNIRRKKKVALL